MRPAQGALRQTSTTTVANLRYNIFFKENRVAARSMTRTVIAALTLCVAATGALAQTEFPTKPVRILTTEAGGSSDNYVRIIAPALTSRWGKQVIVENRPGIIAIETLIRAQPDGYSLLCFASALWIGPLMGRGTYDPFKDVMPVSLA